MNWSNIVLYGRGRWVIIFNPYGDLFVWKGARFNGGGYGYGASPYTYWKIWPIMVKRYWK